MNKGVDGKRARISKFSIAVDPDPEPIRIQDFDNQKLKKKNTAENLFLSFFTSKIAIYSCPSYRRSLQPLKENNQNFKNVIY
jgi:hypothetical protein